jgi:hypothetical protein
MHRSTVTALLLAVCVAFAAPAAGQPEQGDLAAELARLREEVDRLRADMAALRKDLASRPATLQSEAPPPGALLAPATDTVALTDMLRTQVAELAQTKVESSSRQPVRLFGTIHAHGFLNSGEANWLDLPNIAGPREPGGSGTVGAGLRQTRLGFAVDGPDVAGARSSGQLVFDFFGGVPGFQTGQVMPLPRLLVAFARLDGERWAVEAGQDHVLLAPRDPTSLASFAFPALFRSGNLYLRAPQLRVERTLTRHVRLMAGLVSPVGGDLSDTAFRFVPPALGGERSRRPAVQAHLGYASGEPDAVRMAALGLSAHAGTERRNGNFRKGWATALDFAWRYEGIGMAGELFVGDDVDAFGGGQGLETRAAGGWAELRLFPHRRVSVTAGAGVDRREGHGEPTAPRRQNRTVFSNVVFALTPELDASVEYKWLGTLPGVGRERRNHHLDWVLVFRF